jgi:DNA-binding MarR family transcriptional regulator
MKKYLYFVEKIQKINAQYGLTHHEIALLDFSARRYFAKESITVGELMLQRGLASQTTIHKTFKSLVDKRLLATQHHEKDGRIKQVTLTGLALERYKNLDRIMNKGPKSN